MNEYLDTRKSIIISAPAGSGKTERLARRYISLLEDGSEPEKILALTFTEKAAAEMKDRIMKILIAEKPELFVRIKDRTPLMRITTIHSFCRKLITRFSLELGLDPLLDVLDGFAAEQLWSESVYETLRDEKDSPSAFFSYLKSRGIRGWQSLHAVLNSLHERRPYAEFLIETDPHLWRGAEGSLIDLYARCLRKYRNRKAAQRVMDFNDMEILAYRAITLNPGWQNILYAFDEHTDHILVDEFQDTNSIQWKIISKLTEEWRSGMGAKRSQGKTPTIFLVGDEKQSIYMFRGANVSIFQEVRQTFHDWLGEEALCLEATENYRSLPSIIRFSNDLFGKIMQGSPSQPWKTRYAGFSPTRSGEGRVELHLFEQEGNARRARMQEASFIAGKVADVIGSSLPPEAIPSRRTFRYSDIAVLLRSRTHLSSFESAFRDCGIPYIVVGGVGFYDEPEVAILRELVSFLTDPEDDFSLLAVLRSPLFGIPVSRLYPLLSGRTISLYECIRKAKTPHLRRASSLLEAYLEKRHSIPLSELIEEFLDETEGWGIFWETQRRANIRKFIRIIEEYDAAALSHFEIREKLILSRSSNESKANVNIENLDAVRIMTVHGAKGLQFPVVFLPSLDETASSRGGQVFLDELDGSIRFAYEEEPSGREKNPLFLLRKAKEAEEEKRLFYVAVTRAMDWLIMSGAVKRDKEGSSKIRGKLAFIEESFPGSISRREDYPPVFTVSEVRTAPSHGALRVRVDSDSRDFFHEPVHLEKLDLDSQVRRWMTVTEDITLSSRHGQHWSDLGGIFHRLFEELSKGVLIYEHLPERIRHILLGELSLRHNASRYQEIILRDFRKLEESGILGEIILPTGASHTELPFVLQRGTAVYRGRIDRVIVRDNVAFVYDYKTYPVKEAEIKMLADTYRFQMAIYCEACGKLFSMATRAFLVFTHRPLVVEL